MKSLSGNKRRAAALGLVFAAAIFGFMPLARAEAPKVGETAPALSLASTTGDDMSLESVRGRSAVILVFYRGSW